MITNEEPAEAVNGSVGSATIQKDLEKEPGEEPASGELNSSFWIPFWRGPQEDRARLFEELPGSRMKETGICLWWY